MANFKTQMQDVAKTIFREFADIAKNCAYYQVKAGVYDPATGETNSTQRKVQVKAILTDIKAEQTTLGEVIAGDMKALIVAKGLTFNPELNDVLVVDKEYSVVAVMKDPADALFTLHLRLR